MYLNPTGQLGGAESSLVDILASIRHAEPSWPLHLLAASDGPLIGRVRSLGVTAEVLPFSPAIARLGEHSATASGGLGHRLRFASQIALASAAAVRYRAALSRAIDTFDPAIVHTNGLKMHVLGAWGIGSGRRPGLVWHLHDYLGPRRMTTRLLRWRQWRSGRTGHGRHQFGQRRRRCDTRVGQRHSRRHGPEWRRPRPLFDDRRPRESRCDVGAAASIGEHHSCRPRGDAGALEGPRDVPRSHCAAARPISLCAPTLSATRSIRPRAASIRSTSSGSVRARWVSPIVSDSPVSFTHPKPLSEPSTSSYTRARAPEPFGLVIAEAMACGRPVVVSNAGGAAEIITAGADALVHVPGDAGDLAAQIAALAANPELRAQIGRAARRTAERSFDRARLAAELIPIYRSIDAA